MPLVAAVMLLLVVQTPILFVTPAHAGCEETSSDPLEYTCTGDIDSIDATSTSSNPKSSAHLIIVESLTTDITGGIAYTAKDTENDEDDPQPVKLTLTTGSFKVTTTETSDPVVNVFTSSHQGGENDTPDPSGPATLRLNGNVIAPSSQEAPTIQVQSVSGDGGVGDESDNGKDAQLSGNTLLTVVTTSKVTNTTDAGIYVYSLGGNGGKGGGTNGVNSAGDGGEGGDAGVASVSGPGVLTVTTTGAQAPGIVAASQGGQGGKGGSGKPDNKAGNGGWGGWGKQTTVNLAVTTTTEGNSSDAITATSIGGRGGQGGDGAWFDGKAGNGGDSGNAGPATVIIQSGSTSTSGGNSNGIVVQSIGGRGGAAGTATVPGVIAFGADGGSAGIGETVQVENATVGDAPITTVGNNSNGIVAQSLGGAGGHGGSAWGEFYAEGGGGSYGGDGGTVNVTNNAGGGITTGSNNASGIIAQSIGGTGGSGGTTGAIVAFGGNAVDGGNGSLVTVTNTAEIQTGINPTKPAGDDEPCQNGCSYGILAQSVGGGGGNGGSSGGWFSIGGMAGGGGNGDDVVVSNTGDITTNLIESPAIIAQSIGGGGGKGGSAYSAGFLTSVSIGGKGGKGGNGGDVTVNSTSVGPSAITTNGEHSHGIFAHSVGGGGGHGGFAASAAFGIDVPAIVFTIGGNGDSGGFANDVNVYTNGSVTTKGADSGAVVAQSVGGGGGEGGFSLSLSGSDTGSISAAVGGNGGSGDDGAMANVVNGATITTHGKRSPGLVAQSVGGSGGSGGFDISIAAAVESVGLGFGLGGKGGTGGEGNISFVDSTASVTTNGQDSPGIISQSIGGSGGIGGMSISGSLSMGDSLQFAASVGGSGGTGGNSRNDGGSYAASVETASGADVATVGDRSTGIIIQSIGGGGGNGGAAISAEVSTDDSKDLQAAVGGNGNSGGNAAHVSMNIAGDVTTSGDLAAGILLQTIGGGGGNGGTAFTGSLTLSDSTTLGVAVGGKGANAGTGGTIAEPVTSDGDKTKSVTGTVTTSGTMSDGIVAQSVGGGGGNGGYAISGSISGGETTSIGVSVGGGGDTGGGSNPVAVWVDGTVKAKGNGSRGIVVQSIGGGGGTGGAAITGNFSSEDEEKSLSVSVGGAGGVGSAGSTVTFTHQGTIETGNKKNVETRVGEHGILAQSVGGGGGSGGVSINATASTGNKGNQSLDVAVGGSGGTGATSDTVEVTNEGTIETANANSHGILAQSIAGGGGDGGSTSTFDATASSENNGKSFTVSVGGQGGGGAASADVTISERGKITVSGLGSKGIVAQSISGGGGTGGGNVFKSFAGGQSSNDATGNLVVGVGGAGGSSASAAEVSLTTPSATTITTGNSRGLGSALVPDARYASHGVVLQSLGGGGGDGGIGLQGNVSTTSSDDPGLVVGIGGSGGGGGKGGTIVAGTASAPLIGTITTTDVNAFGLLAQTIGGGGGTGGTGIDGNVDNGTSDGITFGLGMTGGGNGGVATNGVKIYSDLAITTLGDGSKGIVAQAIGGGGGSAGVGINGNVTGGSSDDDSTQLTVGIGMSGSNGADGGQVLIDNTAEIQTGLSASGGAAALAAGLTSADAIFAQSIGGGGGSAGAGINGDVKTQSKQSAKSLTLGVSTDGGGGGDGKTVSVTNTGTLSVTGPGARGIVAQSIGGGGGDGGIGMNGDINAASNSDSDQQLNVGIGGSGGKGGSGAKVYVDNGGTVTTNFVATLVPDGQLYGILAQSIGGGGGNGGIGIDGDINGTENSKALVVAIGGGGGSGGSGATGEITSDPSGAGVGVLNTEQIQTVGDGSVGILAQNIGGGGGNAAVGLVGTVDTGKGETISFSLGGTGGDGGDGGTVFVKNQSTIRTGSSDTTSNYATNQAHGILAQSIGGGGGTGQLTGSLLYGSTSSGTEKGLAFTVGGAAGGGDANDVYVEDTGAVTTYNRASHAIYAQSIGGGGGVASDLGGIGTNNVSNTWDAAIAIGGGNDSGSGTDDGDAVTVNATGTQYETYGDGSYAIYAQSIGGGGGEGGNAANLFNSNDSAQTTNNANFAINVGGQNASSGNGGVVTATLGANATALTKGESATAILTQSIGGGGGVGGAGAMGLSGSVTVGGSGSTSGDGQSVTVTSNGQISTNGTAAHGIAAQSIGGGGGYAGGFSAADAKYGSGLDMSLGTDTDGSGGDVSVSVNGQVQTQEASAFGVFAQSVGGGGGVAGSAGPSSSGALIGSSGGSGTAGPVTVTSTGSGVGIQTMGEAAHGIVAQSAGGAGSSTTTDTMVSVTVDSNVTTEGDGSFGIYAQSVGDGRGVIEIEVGANATVAGGSATEALDAAGIAVTGGTENTITNYGVITSQVGTSVTGVSYTGSGTLHVANKDDGVVFGDIVKNGQINAAEDAPGASPQPSPITLKNESGGQVINDGTLDVRRFVNHGTLTAGGLENVGSTTITGNFVQRSGGATAIDLAPQITDQVQIDGNAIVDGQVRFTQIGLSTPILDRESREFLTADGGLTLVDTASATPSVVAGYELFQADEDTLGVHYHNDFASSPILEVTRRNQNQIARYLQTVYQDGSMDETLGQELMQIEDLAAYALAMNSLSAEIAVNNQIAALDSQLRFGERVFSCTDTSAENTVTRFFDDGQCVYARLEGVSFKKDSKNDNLGFDGNTASITFGAQYRFAEDWQAGATFSYDRIDLDSDKSSASSTGDQFFAGLSVKHQRGDWEFGASAAVGYGDYDITRQPLQNSLVTGNQDFWSVSGRARAAYLFGDETTFVKPRIDLAIDHFFSSDFTESGSAATSFTLESGDQTYVSIQPAVEIGTEFTMRNGLKVRPQASLGITHFLNAPSPEVTGRFTSVPGNVATFSHATSIDKTRFDLSAGVKLFGKNDVLVHAGGFASLSENSEIYGANLRVEIPF